MKRLDLTQDSEDADAKVGPRSGRPGEPGGVRPALIRLSAVQVLVRILPRGALWCQTGGRSLKDESH